MGAQDDDSEEGEGEEGLELTSPGAEARAAEAPEGPRAQSPSLRRALRERGGRPADDDDEEGAWLAEKPLLSGDGPRGATELEATLNLLNSLLGNSMLALPWAMAQAGMFLGVVLLLLGTALNRYTLHLLLKHVDMTGSGTYPLIGRCAYGWAGEAVVLGVYLLISGGALCAYAVGLADLIDQLIQAVTSGSLPRPLAGLLAVAVCAPGAFQQSLKNVAKFSALNLLASVLFCLLLVSFVFMPLSVASPTWSWSRTENIPLAWPIFGYVFAVQPSGVMVLTKLEAVHDLRRTAGHADEEEAESLQELRHRISGLAYIVAVTVGALVGMSSYMRFGDLTRGNILESCHEFRADLWPGAITALRLSSATMLLSSAAFVMVPFRFAVVEILKLSGAGDAFLTADEAPAELRKRITWVMLGLMCLVAGTCDDISTVYRLIGSLATQMFALILPGAFALKFAMSSGRRKAVLGPLMVTAFGVISLLVCVAHLLDGTAN